MSNVYVKKYVNRLSLKNKIESPSLTKKMILYLWINH